MLHPPLQLQVKPVRKISGSGNELIGSHPEGAVEFRVSHIQLHAGARNLTKCQSVHLIPGRRFIGIIFAAADIGGQGNAKWEFQAHTAAQTLEQILIHQARADQPRVKRRQIAQVIMIYAECNQRDGLKPYARETLRQSRIVLAAIGELLAAWGRTSMVGLKGIVNGKRFAQ